MTNPNSKTRLACAVLFGTLFLAAGAGASQGDFYQSYANAKVIAQVPLHDGAPQQMFLQREDRKQFLYIQQPSGQGFTVIDVTKPAKPAILSHVAGGNLTMVGSGLAVTEMPDHRASAGGYHSGEKPEGTRGGGSVAPQSVRMMDVSDPAHPKTVQTFDGVTSILQDPARNLIYVANQQGIWIISRQPMLRRHECGSSDAISSAIPNCD